MSDRQIVGGRTGNDDMRLASNNMYCLKIPAVHGKSAQITETHGAVMRRSLWRPTLCALVVALGQGCATLDRPAVATLKPDALHEFMQERMDSGDYPGAVTLIAAHGRIVDWRSYGYRDLARSSPMRRDAIFRVYSMTKTATSVAVLQLAEDGALSLDDPVARHLPEFAALAVLAGGTVDAPILRAPHRPLTIRHLLIHAAGFATGSGDGAAGELLARAGLDRATDYLAHCTRLASVPLAVDPGSRFAYDGVQFVVLSRLVEVVSGMPFDRYLHERLFAPLDMRDTGFVVPLRDRRRIVEMATSDAAGRLAPSPEYANRTAGEMINPYPSGAGGLYSTAGDWLRFSQMLLNRGELDGVRVLTPASVDEMLTNQLPRLDPPAVEFRPGAGFGIGGHLVTDPVRLGRAASAGEFGWNGAAATWYMIDPALGLIAIILMQHLPQGGPRDPPRLGPLFYNLVHQSLAGPHRR